MWLFMEKHLHAALVTLICSVKFSKNTMQISDSECIIDENRLAHSLSAGSNGWIFSLRILSAAWNRHMLWVDLCSARTR